MSIYSTMGSLQRLRDQAILADYANDHSKLHHLDQFRDEMLRLLTGSTKTAQECRLDLRASILLKLHQHGLELSPKAADILIEMLINAPVRDPLLKPGQPALAAE